MKAETRTAVVNFWCQELGTRGFAPDAVVVTAHRADVVNTLENRIFCLKTGSSIYVTAPTEVAPEIQAVSSQLEESTFELLIKMFGQRGKVVGDGPAYIGYLDSTVDQPSTISRLFISDARVNALKSAQPIDWDHFGYAPGSQGLFAQLEGERLLGLAHYEVWAGKIAHIGVIVASTARGRGVGRFVVSAAVNDALRNGLIPQYRTLRSNVPSIKIAERLKFEHFGDSLVIKYGER